ALHQVIDAAGPYLAGLPERLVYDRAAEPLLGELDGPLPERGVGTGATVETLLRVGTATATASSGPRFYHFVIGGSTPAALAAGNAPPSARTALPMPGHGRDTVEVFTRDDIGRIDLAAVRRRLGGLDGAPAVLLATAGEPDAGEFDPLADLADLAERFGAWLH